LIADGHDVVSIANVDSVVLAHALQQGTLLLTEDKDFGDLVFHQHRSHLGVVLIRVDGLSAQLKAELVSAAIREHGSQMPHRFTVIGPAGVRIRTV
jgi:predicted nuclease of predicted toxin-antitoxin system